MIILLVFISCDKTFKAPEPEQLIKQKVMEDILYDIKLLKASKSKSYRVLKDNNVKVDAYIYEKYSLDSITLRENIAFYASGSFKTYKEIENNIKLRFEAEKKKVEAEIAKHDGQISLEKEDVNTSLNLLLSNEYENWRAVNSSLLVSNEDKNKDVFEVLKLVANKKMSQHRIDIPVENLNGKYEFSVFAKKSEMSIVRLRIGHNAYGVAFNLETGEVVGNQENVISTMINKNNGWYKCTIRCTVKNISLARINVFSSTSFADYSGDDIKGVFLRTPELIKINSK